MIALRIGGAGEGGVATHNIKIDDPEVFSVTLTTGQTVAMTVSLPARTYTYYRAIPGHRDAGMIGQSTVR